MNYIEMVGSYMCQLCSMAIFDTSYCISMSIDIKAHYSTRRERSARRTVVRCQLSMPRTIARRQRSVLRTMVRREMSVLRTMVRREMSVLRTMVRRQRSVPRTIVRRQRSVLRSIFLHLLLTDASYDSSIHKDASSCERLTSIF